jgi:hypothetical protein
VADGHLLTTDEAAWVFRRAAELEARTPDHPEALLDQRTLEAAGAEAGLSPVSIRAALEELRAGALAVPEPDPDVPPSRRSIVRTRAVPGPPHQVARALDELARRNLLAVRRRRGATTVWDRRTGVVAACQRVRPHPLCGVARLAVTLGPVPGAPDLVRVELRAEPVPARRLVPLRTRLRVGTGVLLGVGLAVGGLVQAGLDGGDVALTVAGAGGAAWAGASGVRSAREARSALGDALAYVLDRFEHRRTPELVLV